MIIFGLNSFNFFFFLVSDGGRGSGGEGSDHGSYESERDEG